MRMLLRDDRLHTQTDYTFWKKKKEKRVIQTGNAKIHPYRAHSTDLSRSSSLRSTRASRIANISAVDRTGRAGEIVGWTIIHCGIYATWHPPPRTMQVLCDTSQDTGSFGCSVGAARVIPSAAANSGRRTRHPVACWSGGSIDFQ